MGFLDSSRKQFAYYKSLADKSIDVLSEDDLHHSLHEDDNSIAIIIHHMSGNMKSRWTNFLTEDGEKPWRNRDNEFENVAYTKEELIELWNTGWSLLFAELDKLGEEDLATIVYIRNQGHTVEDAIIRQLCHYSYHVGQIVSKAKELTSTGWKSLSIARNASTQYNDEKFGQEKKVEHFLDNPDHQ